MLYTFMGVQRKCYEDKIYNPCTCLLLNENSYHDLSQWTIN